MNKAQILLKHLSGMHLGIQPHRYAKGEPREHPHETDHLEGFGFLISKARGNTNNRVFERDADCLEKEKLNSRPFKEILVKHMFSNCMEQSRDEECREKFEVGRECASWEMESVRKKIRVACEVFAKHLVPDATVQCFYDEDIK